MSIEDTKHPAQDVSDRSLLDRCYDHIGGSRPDGWTEEQESSQWITLVNDLRNHLYPAPEAARELQQARAPGDAEAVPLAWLINGKIFYSEQRARDYWQPKEDMPDNTITPVYAHPAPPVMDDRELQQAQVVGEVHPDDLAVDRFAAAMKEKLAAARAKGRGGWDTEDATADGLSALLRHHVDKGDPRDVANFCMFLHQRGEAITTPQSSAPVVGEVWRSKIEMAMLHEGVPKHVAASVMEILAND